MRKYQAPTESLIKNPQWLATMNFVESMLYPMSDPGLVRNSGTVSDVNYRMVYETVFFGNEKIPGLYSQVVPPARAPEIQPPPTDQIVDAIQNALENFDLSDAAKSVAQGLLLEARNSGRSIQEALSKVGSVTGLSAGVVADIGIKILEPIGWTPDKRSSFKRIVGQAWDRITREGIQPGTARTTPSAAADAATTPSSSVGVGSGGGGGGSGSSNVGVTGGQAGTPYTQPLSSQQRITELANALVRQVQQQRVAELPLGYEFTDVNIVPNARLAEIRKRQQNIAKQLETLDEKDPRRQPLVDEGNQLLADAALEEAGRNGGMEYMFIPGRGPVGKVDQVVIDYAKRIPLDPSKFTLDAIRFDARMIAEMKKYPGAQPDIANFISEADVGPTLRQYAREGKLPDLYNRLSQVDPSWDDRRVLDFNGIDEYTTDRFTKFAASAQNLGLTVDQYLDQLMNDPDQISRVQQERRNSGGGGGVTIRLPSDDDLTSVFKYVSQATIGRTLPKEVYQSMIDAYKPQLVRFQQQLQGGGTVTEPPQAETFAETQIGEQFGQEKFTYKLGGFLNELSKLAGGGM